MEELFANGQIILIDKPLTWTSFDAVKKLKSNLKIKKIGHAGTLDPLATGLLIICTGKFTKKIEELQNGEKEYVCKMYLGKSTPSFDLETEFNQELPIDHITLDQISEVVRRFVGEIQQTPPAHSAVKVDGKRAYQLARKGIEPEIKSRQVTIHEISIGQITLPELELTIRCSKGTYIRSLVRDIGLALGTCAHMTYLRRTKIGNYHVDEALSPEVFIQKIKTTSGDSALVQT
jgi:tRNA pseudouridine55 synthase